MRKWIIIGLITLLASSVFQVSVYAGTMNKYNTRDNIPLDAPLFDLLILRPMGIASCAVGLAASIVALPFAVTSGSGAEVTEQFITEPFEYTFRRPIGYDY
jgi:hypothetical protein